MSEVYTVTLEPKSWSEFRTYYEYAKYALEFHRQNVDWLATDDPKWSCGARLGKGYALMLSDLHKQGAKQAESFITWHDAGCKPK